MVRCEIYEKKMTWVAAAILLGAKLLLLKPIFIRNGSIFVPRDPLEIYTQLFLILILSLMAIFIYRKLKNQTPSLVITQTGLEAPLLNTGPIPWQHITEALLLQQGEREETFLNIKLLSPQKYLLNLTVPNFQSLAPHPKILVMPVRGLHGHPQLIHDLINRVVKNYTSRGRGKERRSLLRGDGPGDAVSRSGAWLLSL